MSGWAQREAEEREDRKEEIVKLDAMLNAAIEAAGLDPATASVDDLIAWIRERREAVRLYVHLKKRIQDEFGIDVSGEWENAVIGGEHDVPLPDRRVSGTTSLILAWLSETSPKTSRKGPASLHTIRHNRTLDPYSEADWYIGMAELLKTGAIRIENEVLYLPHQGALWQ